MSKESFFIVGGAGFVGSYFADELLSSPDTSKVSIFDNFTSGREWHLEHHLQDDRFQTFRGDAKNLDELVRTMEGHDVVIHLASNPDIARAITEPDIDFREGTVLSQNVAEAMRRTGTKRFLYASGSGVYGDIGEEEAREDAITKMPISTYGASKLAGESIFSSYCHMFDMSGSAFRFGNVVGSRQTHGVGFDFARRLLEDPSHLSILGDGSQSKSYIHVQDIVNAVLLAHKEVKTGFEVFNVATGDYITVKEIADIAVQLVCGDNADVRFEYTGGDRGWIGDIPIVRIGIERIKKLGWKPQRNSREAIESSISDMITMLKTREI